MKKVFLWFFVAFIAFTMLNVLYLMVQAMISTSELAAADLNMRTLPFVVFMTLISTLVASIWIWGADLRWKYDSSWRLLKYIGSVEVLTALKRKATQLDAAFESERAAHKNLISHIDMSGDADTSGLQKAHSEKLEEAKRHSVTVKWQFWDLHGAAKDAGFIVFPKYKDHAEWITPAEVVAEQSEPVAA